MRPAVCLLIIALSINASGAAFRLDPAREAVLAGSGLALSVTSLALQYRASTSPATGSTRPVPGVDAWAQRPYSRAQDLAGDVTTACAAASVISLVPGSDGNRLVTYGVMYLESLLFSFGTENTLKSLLSRSRPFTYYPNAPAGLYEGNDHLRSFPSAHTTLAFTGASFASVVYCVDNPDSPWRPAVVGGACALAVGTAALRVSSGNHFPTDVLAAAAIGAASGLLVPLAHHDGMGEGSRVSIQVDPGTRGAGIVLQLR